MPLVLVTGPSGAGKSAVAAGLRRRGHPAYDTDHDRLSHWHAGDVPVGAPPVPDDAWYAAHTLRLPPPTVERIAAEVGDDLGFICGTTGNEGEIWSYFAAVVSLSVSTATLRRRLATRPPGAFGSTPDDVRRILGWAENLDETNARYGAILVSAEPPLEAVVDSVLAAVRRKLNRPPG